MITREKKIRKAIQKVNSIKEYYKHIAIAVIFNAVLLIYKSKLVEFVSGKTQNAQITEWFEMNLLVIPIIWVIVLAVYGLYLFGTVSSWVSKWEQKQIEKYMNNH